MTVSPGSLLGRYQIVSPLGAGGMGEVYLARDSQLGRQVAIKFPTIKSDEDHTHARFQREARSVSLLSHRNIATVYDYGETEDGHPYLVMELIKGESLSDLMHSSSLTLTRSVEIIADVAEALCEAHRLGIIHRDIKPSNVMINDRGEVKVLDFGLAKQLHDDLAGEVDKDAQTLLATQTRSGVVVGTPLYLSPEQAKGDAVDARSDIFALGSLLYECITGRTAFFGKSVFEITAQIIHIDPPDPSTINPHVPPELDRITMKALAKAPESRYQSAGEMLGDLRAVQTLIDEEAVHHTRRISPGRSTHSSAFHTLSDMLKQPRLSIGRLLLAFTVLGMVGFLVWFYLIRPKQYQPSASAKELYELGTAALRDGAYNQASNALQQAIAIEPNFALAHARLAEAQMELDYVDNAKDEQLKATTLAADRAGLTSTDSLYLDAITASVRRDFAPAIKAYQEIARLTPNEAHVYVDLGRAFENNGDMKSATESYIKATELGPNYATAYLRAGILYGRDTKDKSAYAAFDKAEELYRARGNNEGRAEVLFQRGALAVSKGLMDEARDQLNRGWELAKALDNYPQQIKTMLQLVYVVQNSSDADAAQKLASDAITLAQTKGMQTLVARGLVDLGTVFFVKKNYTEAEKYFRQALDYSERYKARGSEAKARFNIGNVLITQGKIDEGVGYVEQARDFYKQNGFRLELARVLTSLARAYRDRGNYDAALEGFRERLVLAEQANDDPQRALSYEGIAFVLVRQGSYLDALDHFRKNYEINKSMNSLPDVRNSLINQASVLWQIGYYQDARSKLNEALPSAEMQNDKNKAVLAEYLLIEAQMALSERKLPEAKIKITEAIKLLGETPSLMLIDAKLVFGTVQSLGGSKREGRILCGEVLELAAKLGDPWIVARARAALAEAMLENADTSGAVSNALDAREIFAKSGQLDWEWRTWLIAARASRRADDVIKAREYAGNARDALTRLQQKWGAETFGSYLKRADVQTSQKQLKNEFEVSN